MRDYIDMRRGGQHIVVGTPGRVFDMLSKRHLRMDDLLTFVCDEADEVLSRGFKDQIYNIFKRCLECSGVSLLCHHGARESGSHHEVYARRGEHPLEERRFDVGGYSPVPRCHREVGVEARHTL